MRRLALSFTFLLAATALRADPPDPRALLEATARQLATKHKVASARVGVHVARVEDGAEVFALAGHEPLGVASNAKLVTTAAALHWLGPDWKWRTRVHLVDGALEGSKWSGHLLVVGSGDPNLSGRFHADNPTAVFETWAESLTAAGVSEIGGDLLLDDHVFDREWVHPSWPPEQLQNWYCAPVSGLALNDDCVDVSVASGDKAGAPAKITLSPATSFFRVVNQCVTVTQKKKHVFSILRDGTGLTVKGGYILKGGGYTESIAVSDPPGFFGAVLKETLARKGVAVGGAVRLLDEPWAPAPDPATAAAVWESPIGPTVQVTNQRSQNFYAEQVLKTMGAARYGQGTFETGRTCMRAWLTEIGVPVAEATISDGCGLSAENLYSPAAITTVLCKATKAPWAQTYIDSLAISGQAGTLEKRMREKGYAGRVRGKTGYIAGVSSLSGYVETQHHGTWAFSILVNGFRDLSRARRFQDDLCKAMIDLPGGE